MSQGIRKTLDRQTLHFAGVLAQNLPTIDSETMQAWVKNPKLLQLALAHALAAPTDTLDVYTSTDLSKMQMGIHANVDGHITLGEIPTIGLNPFAVEERGGIKDWHSANLCLSVEYLQLANQRTVMLRPWLEVGLHGSVGIVGSLFSFPAAGYIKKDNKWGAGMGAILLERPNYSLTGAICQMKSSIAQHAAKLFSYTLRLRVSGPNLTFTLNLIRKEDNSTALATEIVMPRSTIDDYYAPDPDDAE